MKLKIHDREHLYFKDSGACFLMSKGGTYYLSVNNDDNTLTKYDWLNNLVIYVK